MYVSKKNWSTALGLSTAILVASAHAALGVPADSEHDARNAAQTAQQVTTPVDPVIEEPLRPLGTRIPDSVFDRSAAECGAMNGFTLPIGVLLVSGIGWIPRGRTRRRDNASA